MQRSTLFLFAFLSVLVIFSGFSDARRRRRHNPPPPPPKPQPKPATPPPPPIITLSDQAIWNKYRTRLAYEVAKRNCGGQIQCDFVSRTEFQFMSTPMSATWHQDRQNLNRDVCGYAPAWSVSYKPRDLSHDGVISELYKKYLLQSKNLSQYKAFMAQQPTTDNVYYNWNENGLTLAQFVNNARSKTSDAFSFNININTEETPKNSWANLGGYTGEKSFIRVYTGATTKSDSLSDHLDSVAADTQLFGRGRTVYHHVYQTKTVVVKTNKFDFQMSAIDFAGIQVSPAGEWFNKADFINNKATLSGLGYLGAGGKFPLLPNTVIVAYKPRVEIVVSKSVYEQIARQISDSATLGWLVGGAKFLNPQVKALNDDGTVEYFTEEEKKSGKAAQMADQILIEPINEAEEKFFKGSSDLERFFDETSKYGQMADSDYNTERKLSDTEYNTERKLSDSEFIFSRRRRSILSINTEADSEFLFRRRTRHRTVVHVTTKEVPEGNYKISWISNSDVPQILGVITERL